jgi:regulator of protease activity HflC (stomatin/prohibitin superfamily)
MESFVSFLTVLGVPIFGLIAFILIVSVLRAIRIVRQNEKALVLRLGKYQATRSPGIVFMIPFIERMIKVDMRETVINVQPQQVITKDNVSVVVDAVVYFRVVDPVKSEFEVEDFEVACTTLAQTNLRNLIGEQQLDETLVARDSINNSLRLVLDEATNSWGVKVTRVEVQRIDPPADITEAMSRQMKAERDKRARILQAQGIKEGEILEAEGKKQSAILKAEGSAQAVRLEADAEAKAIEEVANASEKYFKDRAQAQKKLEVLEKTLKDNVKYIIPADSDVLNILGLDSDSKNVVPVKRKSS